MLKTGFLRQKSKGETDMTNPPMASAKPAAVLRGGKAVLASTVKPVEWTDPAVFFSRFGRLFTGSRFFWTEPGRRLSLVGFGEAFRIESETGEGRFAEADRKWRAAAAAVEINGEAPPCTGPVLFGGFSFDPASIREPLWRHFPSARLTVPRYLLTVRDGRAWLTENRLVPADGDDGRSGRSDPAVLPGPFGPMPPDAGESAPPAILRAEEQRPDEWKAAVAQAASAIRAGRLDKVVLARRLTLKADGPFRPEPVLRRLLAEQLNTYVFAIESGGSCLIGATPERLVKKTGNRLTTVSLAGSAARGATPEEDDRIGAELARDGKNMLEHALAVGMIRSVLARYCTDVRLPDAPLLHKLKDIQHLLTPIEGDARGDVSLFDVVEALHPTPALGGMPKTDALAMIRGMESMDRGWYAAPIGWIDWRMDGEFAAAIRSALLAGNEAVLFAGCGIVGDSDPDAELTETRLKFRPMLSALGALQEKRGEGAT